MRVDFSKELGWCQRMAKRRFPGIAASAWTANIISWADDTFRVILWTSIPIMKANMIVWERGHVSQKTGKNHWQLVIKDKKYVRTGVLRNIKEL